MKPIVPNVPLPVWRELYAAAQRFQERRPWEVMDDYDFIGVRDPTTGDTGFSFVMGSAGILIGMCFYRGAEGLDVYRRLDADEISEEDFLFVQNCVKLDLGSRTDLWPEDLAVIRALGLTFRGKQNWPQFRNHEPGFVPWFLDEAEARSLTLGIDAALFHHSRILSGEVTEYPGNDDVLIYTPVGDTRSAFDVTVETWPKFIPPAPAPIILDLARVTALRSRTLAPDSSWEAAVFHWPVPIGDAARPYFGLSTVVCQQVSGFAFAFSLHDPGKSAHQALADEICKSIEEHGFLPDIVYVKDTPTARALEPLAVALGFTLWPKSPLDAIRVFREEMFKHLEE